MSLKVGECVQFEMILSIVESFSPKGDDSLSWDASFQIGMTLLILE